MDYVAILRAHKSVPAAERDAALARRAAWKYPDGLDVIAEYWPMSGDIQVVSVFTAESATPLLELVFEWNDVFDLDIFPAVSAEDGLRLGPDVFSRLQRLQQPS